MKSKDDKMSGAIVCPAEAQAGSTPAPTRPPKPVPTLRPTEPLPTPQPTAPPPTEVPAPRPCDGVDKKNCGKNLRPDCEWIKKKGCRSKEEDTSVSGAPSAT